MCMGANDVVFTCKPCASAVMYWQCAHTSMVPKSQKIGSQQLQDKKNMPKHQGCMGPKIFAGNLLKPPAAKMFLPCTCANRTKTYWSK